MTTERRNPANDRNPAHRALYRFRHLPAAYCHPERITALLPDALPATFGHRLRTSKRLRSKLSTLLIERYALDDCSDDDLTTSEALFARLEGEELRRAILSIGAIWHARTLRRIILKEQLRLLIDKLGRDTYRRALGLIDLAPEEEGAQETDTPDIDALMVMIERDGVRAINAWCRHQPSSLAERLRLKLPPGGDADGLPPAPFQRRGLIIVDRMAMSLRVRADDDAS